MAGVTESVTAVGELPKVTVFVVSVAPVPTPAVEGAMVIAFDMFPLGLVPAAVMVAVAEAGIAVPSVKVTVLHPVNTGGAVDGVQVPGGIPPAGEVAESAAPVTVSAVAVPPEGV
jgi:hypothetical protein